MARKSQAGVREGEEVMAVGEMFLNAVIRKHEDYGKERCIGCGMLKEKYEFPSDSLCDNCERSRG
jgi:hypothetical protein